MHLYLIRHGQSYVNLADWKPASPAEWDASLTPLGQRQAAALAKWLPTAVPHADALYASTMKRAQETAVSPSPLSSSQKIELSAAVGLLGVNRLVLAGILMSTFGLYLRQLLGETVTLGRWSIGVATLTGLGLGITALLNMASAPLVGRLSDRVGNRWRVVSGSVATGMTGFGLLALGLPLAVLLGLPLTSIASGSNQGLSTALVGDLAGDGRHSGKSRSGRYLGILFTVGDLGSAIGPPLAYALLPLSGIQWVYWLCVMLLTPMLLASLWRNGRQLLPIPVK